MKKGSVEVGPPAPSGEGRARRGYALPDKLVTGPPTAPEVKVLADVLKRSAKKFGPNNALGYRDVIKVVQEEKDVTKTVGGKEITEKKKWSYFQLSDYKYYTYDQVYETVKVVGSALVATGHSKDTIFNIYAATSAHWQMIANGCALQSITFATAYDSLGEEGLEHSINEPSVYGIFTNAGLVGTIAAVIDKTPTLKVLVYDGKTEDVKAGAIDKIKAANGGISIYTFDEFLELGRKNFIEPNPSGPNDLCTIMYTSGSTGAPKGVMITNANIVATIGAVEVLLGDIVKNGEVYIAYLPLAHIMEFVVEMCMMFVGATLGYGSPKTLTDASVRNCYGDIRTLQPTIMVGVPAVFELIRKGILAKVKEAGGFKSGMFNAGMTIKRMMGGKGRISDVVDAVVFKAIKESTGGRLRVALSGGAQISQETQEFLSIALVKIVQGYGMTESCAMCAVLPPAMHRYNSVGVPVPSAEVKLIDVPEAGYFSTNNPPQGEIALKGPSISLGYYKREDITKETITEDGWLKTGDIGQWNDDGTLSLIDRKKNLVKLSGGEYIALERLESVYKSCQYVSNICVYGDTQASRPMAIIFPHEGNIKALAKERKISGGTDLHAICADKAIQDAVLKDINAVGRKAGLRPLEQLQTIVLSPEEWTPHNGLLTAAQKLQRKAIIEKYKSDIDAVYP